MAVPIEWRRNGQLEAGAPVPLATHIGGAVSAAFRQQYVVSADGQRFLMITISESASSTPITVVLNATP